MTEAGRRPGPAAVWVVTGPIGGGKSAATAVLAELGATVIDADAVGHDVLRRPEIIAALSERFGTDILRGGEVDRPALGRLAFADAASLAALDRITHPPLAAELARRVAAAPAGGLAVVEAAVYFRLPPFGPVDLVIAVTAPEALRR
ncbi:dephospho-CoA kinase, partial [bacterium]|nr:dephospho-CoA kinase [bacterium]